MTKTPLRVAALMLLFSATALQVHGQAASPPNAPQTTDNYYYLRDQYFKVHKEEAKREKRSERHGKKMVEGDQENLYENEFARWDWYWRDRQDATLHVPGQLANVGQYMRNYYDAARSGSGDGGPSVQSTPSVCTSGGGNWTTVGPATYTSPIIGKVNNVYINPSNLNEMYVGTGGGGVFKTVNNGSSWTSVTDGARLPCSAITGLAIDPVSPTTMFYGSNNNSPTGWGIMSNFGFGLMKTTNGGSTWNEVLSVAPYGNVAGNWITCVRIHPQDHNTIYAAICMMLFRSTDGGATWTKVLDLTPSPNPNSCSYLISDIDIIPGATGVVDSKLVLGTNFVSWNGSLSSPCAPALAYYSSNGGTSWTNITSVVLGGSLTDRFAAAVQPANTTDFFFNYVDGSSQFVIKRYNTTSNTVTQTWSCSNYESGGYWDLEFEFSKINPNTVYGAGTTLYKYDISTSTIAPYGFSSYWATDPTTCAPLASTHADVRALTVATSGGNDVLMLGDDGGVQKATTSPTAITMPTWSNIAGAGLNITQCFGLAGSETYYDELVTGTQDNGTQEYYNGTWRQRYNYDGYRGYINPNTHVYWGLSNAGGLTGTTNTAGAYTGAAGTAGNCPVVGDPNNPGTLYAAALSGSNWVVNKSTNSGASWSSTSFPGTTLSIRSIRIAPSDPNILYVVKDGPTWGATPSDRVYKGVYSGSSWTWTDISATGPFALQWAVATDLAIDPNNPNRVWMSFNSYWAVSNGSTVGVCRVYATTDGGATWNDVTYNMLAFPVNCLVYQNGSDDAVYAGTEVGVFRFNKTTSTWDCFNYGLPVVAVTGLEINACKGKIRASTYGRGIYESDLPATSDYTISTNTTWSGSRYITNDIFVTSGATLTVTGTVYMGQGKRIKVDRGATLLVNGGKLTNCCGNMWQGVEVWGTSTALQNVASAQGKLVMQNNAVLENALEGVSLVKMNGLTPDMTYTGGIVQAISTSFYNNRRDVAFYSYHWYIGSTQKNNLSYFKNCKFETNQRLNDASQALNTHISVNDVFNPIIAGCQFNNTTSTSIYSVNLRGGGVTSLDGVYTIDDYYNSLIFPPTLISSSKFNGLTTGVQADFTSSAVKSVWVYFSDFDNVQRGIQISNAVTSIVNSNTFTNVPLALTTNFTDATWAIRYNNTSALQVVSNTVTGASPSYQNNYGTIIDNCGSSANVVSFNTYKDLYVGIQAQGNNGSGSTGVQFKCNTFQQAIRFQITVNPSVSGSIANQGGTTCVTGQTRDNTFYVSSTPTFNQIYSPINTFSYYASGVIPTYYTGVTVISCGGVTDECQPPCQNCMRMTADAYENQNTTDSLIADLEQQHTTEANIILAGTYIEQGRFDKVNQLIAGFRHQALNDEADYFALQLSLAQNGKKWYDMSDTQLDRISEIADGKSGVSYSAQTVMGLVKGQSYIHYVERIGLLEDDAQRGTAGTSLIGNVPNPFNTTTTIHCMVDKSVVKAELEITTSTGELLQTLPLTSGDNNVVFDGSALTNGVYYYSLIADGKRVETKKMVIIRQ